MFGSQIDSLMFRQDAVIGIQAKVISQSIRRKTRNVENYVFLTIVIQNVRIV